MGTTDSGAREVLVVSQAAANWKHEHFAAICSTARRNNATRALSAELLFDGERFAQLIRGPDGAVDGLLRVMVSDPRHRDLRVLAQAPASTRADHVPWLSGFCDPDALNALFAERGPQNGAAIAAMRRLLGGVDLSA